MPHLSTNMCEYAWELREQWQFTLLYIQERKENFWPLISHIMYTNRLIRRKNLFYNGAQGTVATGESALWSMSHNVSPNVSPTAPFGHVQAISNWCLTYLMYLSASSVQPIRDTLHRKYLSFRVGQGIFWILGMKIALCALGAQMTIGSWVWLIHPFFQSILSCVAANQGYPRITLCSPKSDRKNLRVVVFCPVWMFRSV